MPKNILILTEAGNKIGLGHFTRCSALREEYKAKGNKVDMLVYVQEYRLEDPDIQQIDWLNNEELIGNSDSYDMVIVDSYLAATNIYKKLSLMHDMVIAIDDYNRMTYPANWLINPNVFFSDIDYSNQSAKCVGGKDFVILRSEFRNSPKDTHVRNSINEILVTIGGSDYRKIIASIMESCLTFEAQTIKVVAPFEIRDCPEDERLEILPIQDAGSMCELMKKADIVISACGQTLHELAALNKPTIGICLDIDQKPNQKYYLNQGILTSEVNWDDFDLQEKIVKNLRLLDSSKKRIDLIEQSKKVIDKDGVANFADTTLNFLND